MKTKYGTLYDILYECIKSGKQGDSNFIIATYIMKHIDDMENTTIYTIAKECHVSVATVSRFAKKVGFEDFNHLKDVIDDQMSHIGYYLSSHPISDIPFASHDKRSIDQSIDELCSNLKDSFDEELLEKIDEMVMDLIHYDNVYFYGLASVSPLISHISNELRTMGKYTHEIVNLDLINTIKETNCLVIVSMYGTLYEYMPEEDKKFISKKCDRVWIISQKQYSQLRNALYLKKTATSTSDYMAWMLLAEQIIYSYKKNVS